MDKKSKVLLYAFLILTLLSAGITYHNMMVKRNFVVIDSTEIPVDTEVVNSTY